VSIAGLARIASGTIYARTGVRGRRWPRTYEDNMNNIIYIVGLVVVVLAVLYFFGLA
jgi:hypothetical protein